jgi:hypothetical protein
VNLFPWVHYETIQRGQLSRNPLGSTQRTIMNKQIFLMLSFIYPFLIFAQDKPKIEKVELAKQSLSWLKTVANPEKDLIRSLLKGDTSFVGIQGYSVIVPGVKDYYNRFKSKYKVKIIPGTGDAFSTNEEMELQDKAIAYAEKYNICLLKILKQKSNRK